MDEKAFGEIYQTHLDAIFRHCYFRVSDRDQAQDLAQATFIKTWEYLRKGKRIDNMKAFLYKVANNLVVDYYRQKKAISLDALKEKGFEPVGDRGDKVINKLDEEILKKMKAAGCILVRFGIESGSQNMLSYLKNNSVKTSQAYQAIALCQKVGLPSFGSFIIGSPEETVNDLVQTLDFIEKSGLAYADVFNMVPYPGTDIYNLARANNLIKPGVTWNDFQIEGKNCQPILRSYNFNFEQIEHIKSYINLNVVYPLNHKIPLKKLNHQKELTKVLAGDLSCTEFSPAGRRKMKMMKLYDKIIRVLKDPILLIIYLKQKINRPNHAIN